MITSKEMMLFDEHDHMNQRDQKKILLVDSKQIKLEEMFEGSDYSVVTADSETEIVEKVSQYKPDILLGDFLIDGISCEALCSRFQTDILFRSMPVIMVTDKKHITHRIRTVNGSVDDYIVYPFAAEEILARIKRVIHRKEQALNANPLTRLPGNIAIRNDIETRLAKEEKFATCFLDLDNFKSFNDYYGFDQGDKAIELTSKIILSVVSQIKTKNISKDFFVGHIGGDDFVVISPIEEIDSLCSMIIKNFDEKIISLYNQEDLVNKFIVSQDRRGKTKKFPVMTISIAVVSNEKRKIRHTAEISQIGTEIKTYIKKFPNSNYLSDRRV